MTTSHKLMEQPTNRSGKYDKNINRYNLQFTQESKKELEIMKEDGFKPLNVMTSKEREMDASYFEGFDFPVRPPWSFDSSKEQLDRNENRYFKVIQVWQKDSICVTQYFDLLQEYVDEVFKKLVDSNELSLFELNLETWRQLWRVLEFSDILLIIVDVRYASLQFPPSLYTYIIRTLKKNAIVILNKVDLVEAEAVIAWRQYFNELYPELPVVLFASYSRVPKDKQKKAKAHQRSMKGVFNIFRECQRYVQNDVDLSNWESKIRDDMCDSQDDELKTQVEGMLHISSTVDTTPHQHSRYQNDILTIGCIGFPNVGKSSLINALKGRKVVSVSRTPGKTKHFQTIFLTNNVRLCDCPGLVFPSRTPKRLQVLLGSFPISQLQVPYRSLKLLAEHIDLPELLRVQLPDDYDEWSAVAISDAWAYKRGFVTAKAARPDRYRAANNILRMCLAGQQQLVLQLYPPGYHEKLETWHAHPDLSDVKYYQEAEQASGERNEDLSSTCTESKYRTNLTNL